MPSSLNCFSSTLISFYKSSLVIVTGIRPLLYLYHFNLFQHLESMPAIGQQNDIAGPQYPAFQIVPAIVIEIHLENSPSNDKDLLRKEDFPGNGIMAVGIDFLA